MVILCKMIVELFKWRNSKWTKRNQRVHLQHRLPLLGTALTGRSASVVSGSCKYVLQRLVMKEDTTRLNPCSVFLSPPFPPKLWQWSVWPLIKVNGLLAWTSYVFRRYRSAADAIEMLHSCLSHHHSAQWVLEGDIKGCFDHISHDWLLTHILMDKDILRKWLECGVVFNKLLMPTKTGTPRGGIASPTLANFIPYICKW